VTHQARTRLVQLRVGQVYCGDSPSLQSLAVALHEQKVTVLGEGNNRMALVHADDAAACVVAIADEAQQTNKIENWMKIIMCCFFFFFADGRQQLSGYDSKLCSAVSCV
jgi:hypothetical protein